MVAKEQRSTPRLDIQGEATFAVCGEAAGARCVIDNVSQGGTRFFAARELPVGSCVELRIASPDDGAEIVLRVQILRVVPGKESGMFDYACRLESVENG